MKKTADNVPMTANESREILSAIARDPNAYERDRIAGVKLLHELGLEEPFSEDDIYPARSDQAPPARAALT